MAFKQLAKGNWGSSPKIPYTFYYEKSRSGKDMIYKIKVVLGTVSGSSYFGYPIKVSVNCGGKTAEKQVKDASPSQWTTNIEYQTNSLTVSNKTTGTTSLSIVLTGVSASRGSTTYNYNLPIDPAASGVSAANANIGSVSKITISKTNNSFTHTLQYSFDGSSFKSIVTKTSAATYNWTVPTEAYNYLGAANKSRTITIKCITYSGSTEIGSTTTTMYGYAVSNQCKPDVSITITNNSANAALTGSADTIINNNGGVTITGAATAKYNAAILKQTKVITIGKESFKGNSKTLNSLSSGTIQFAATDTRGYSNSASISRTVIYYTKPTISIGVPTVTSAGVASFAVKGNWFNGSFGAANNTLTLQYAYGQANGSYSDWTAATATVSGNSFSCTISISGLDYKKRYQFKARIIDKLNTVNSSVAQGQAIPVFDWGQSDFQFHVPVAADSLSTGDLTTRGEVEIYGETPHIDFHFDNSAEDYTTRIIETSSGKLNIAAPNGVLINGNSIITKSDVSLSVVSNRLTDTSITAKYIPILGMVFVRIYGKTNATLNAGNDYDLLNIGSNKPAATSALSVKCSKNACASAKTAGVISIRPFENISSGYAVYIAGFWFV